MKGSITFILFLVSFAFAKAQLESSFWYFGQNAGIDFNSGTAMNLDNGQLITGEGCATISDAGGNLLFYTDGSVIYNRNHTIMPNGTGLKGNSSSTSSAIIVPDPASGNRYFIFTVDTDDLVYRDTEGMFYSVVDMTLDNGNGDIDVFEKNINLLAITSEKLTSVRNFNEDGYWIVTHFENRFYAYELTTAGLNTNPVISTVDPFIELVNVPITNVDVSAMRGYIKLNETGDKLVAAHFSNNTTAEFAGITNILAARSLGYANGGELYLYDFDNDTGIVSNPIPLSQRADNGSFYGVEFSSDGRYLYTEADYMQASTTQIFTLDEAQIIRYDLTAANIPASRTVIYTDFINPLRGALQIGIDDKIYHTTPGQSALNTIPSPNDLNPTFELASFDLAPGTLSSFGLPIFVQSFIASAQILGEDHCFGTTQSFEISSNSEIIRVQWDFGDPNSGTNNTSDLINPTHLFTQPGTYIITASITTNLGITTSELEIEVFENVEINTYTKTLTACNEGFERAVFDLSAVISQLAANQPNQTIEVFNDLIDAQNGLNPITDVTNVVNNGNPDILWIKVSNSNCEEILQLDLIVENCDVEIFNILTPNGDGKNDVFIITGLRNIYLNHKLKIFNRLGTQVWEGGNNDDPWDGTANRGIGSTGEILPTGTYFYILEFNEDNLEPKSGYVYLQ